MTLAIVLVVAAGLGFGFRGFISREKNKLGAFVKSEAAKGESMATALVDRFKKAL